MACSTPIFLFVCLWSNNTVCPYEILFIHLSVDDYLNGVHSGALMNNATLNVHVLVFVWTCVFISLA